MGWKDIEDGYIKVCQEKTKAYLGIPIAPALVEAIKSMPTDRDRMWRRRAERLVLATRPITLGANSLVAWDDRRWPIRRLCRKRVSARGTRSATDRL